VTPLSTARAGARTKSTAGKKPLTLDVSPRTVADLTAVFKQLADESRLKILLALGDAGEMHVSALCRLLGQTQPAVSHHLTLLRLAGLVTFHRRGKQNFYRVDCAAMGELVETFFREVGCSKKPFQLRGFSLAFARNGH
jgi:ArsR family transcriptional regulator